MLSPKRIETIAESETILAPFDSWLNTAVHEQPQASAIIIEDEELDFTMLNSQVEALIGTLKQVGIKHGERFSLATDSARIVALASYAAPNLGITFLPLSPQLSPRWQQSILSQARVKHILCDNEASSQWPDHINVITIGQLLLFQFSINAAGDSTAKDIDIPLMLATSGSSEVPKVVMLSHENIRASVQITNHQLELDHHDCWLNCLPLNHIGGLMILYRCLAATACVILHDHFDAQRVWHDLQKYPVSHLSLVPTMLLRLLDASNNQPPPASLKLVIIGGASLEPALAQRALENGWPLYMTYGMTETSSQIAGCHLNNGMLNDSFALNCYEGVEVKIINKPSSTDASGQIALRGKQIMAGYAQESSASGPDKDGWLLTHDIGKLDSKGRLIILGRADDIIISGGENINPLQVEAILNDCPGIDEVAITGKEDPEWGQCIIALYNGSGTIEKVEEWSKEKLKGGWRPRQFIKIEGLPRLDNGKLDRQSLVELTR